MPDVRLAARVALVFLALAWVGPAAARVAWYPWMESSFTEAVDKAATEKKPVVLVVTQPDWCPPCIKLDRAWLENPDDSQVAGLTKDAVVLEVRGYDAAGGELLKRQGVRFQGTPTVFVYRPARKGTRLGDAPLAGSIVGAPPDFPDRLGKLLAGEDPLAAARVAVDAAKGSPDQAKALRSLADILTGRGEADAADAALSRIEALASTGLTAADAVTLDAARRAAAWDRVATLDLRVRKDGKRALAGIDAFTRTHPASADEAGDVAYAKAWALSLLGRDEDAIRALEPQTVALRTADGYETFLYFCFRAATPRLLAEGERRGDEALSVLKEPTAGVWEGLGRVRRRMGRWDQAEVAFQHALDLAKSDDLKATLVAQLGVVREERAAHQPHPPGGGVAGSSATPRGT